MKRTGIMAEENVWWNLRRRTRLRILARDVVEGLNPFAAMRRRLPTTLEERMQATFDRMGRRP